MTLPKLHSNWMQAVIEERKTTTYVFSIENKKTGDRLGRVLWRYRKYIFVPENDPRYEIELHESCLRAIAKFIKDLMEERKT